MRLSLPHETQALHELQTTRQIQLLDSSYARFNAFDSFISDIDLGFDVSWTRTISPRRNSSTSVVASYV